MGTVEILLPRLADVRKRKRENRCERKYRSRTSSIKSICLHYRHSKKERERRSRGRDSALGKEMGKIDGGNTSRKHRGDIPGKARQTDLKALKDSPYWGPYFRVMNGRGRLKRGKREVGRNVCRTDFLTKESALTNVRLIFPVNAGKRKVSTIRQKNIVDRQPERRLTSQGNPTTDIQRRWKKASGRANCSRQARKSGGGVQLSQAPIKHRTSPLPARETSNSRRKEHQSKTKKDEEREDGKGGRESRQT